MKGAIANLMRFGLLAVILLAVALPLGANAQSPPTSTGAQYVLGFCGGDTTGATANTNGIIGTPLLGGSASATQGIGTVVIVTSLIMLVVLLAMGILYMISTVANLPGLTNTVKSELAEVAATGIVISICFGGFFAASQLTSTNTGHAFFGPPKNLFVQDCAILSGASTSLVVPSFFLSVADSFINQTVSNTRISLEPSGFGFEATPLKGLVMLPQTIDPLISATSVISIALLAITFLLGLIYSLFPIFLYSGIVLRAFPWTRAAGGVFIAVFIGFFIVFPCLLYITLNNFGTVTVQRVSNFTAQPYNSMGGFISGNVFVSNSFTSTASAPGLFNNIGNTLLALEPICASSTSALQCHGLVNGYIYSFLEPSFFTILGVIFSFIISLDVADVLADLLGAPSLQAANLLGRVL